MPAPSPIDRKLMLRNVAETLAFAAVGGLTLGHLGMPAGYLSGSILAVACASLAGRPMIIPLPLMRCLMVLIGVSLGAVVTPATLNGVATYPLSIATLIVAMICVSVSGAAYLRVVHGWDMMTAYLASAPGGLSQVMGLAADIDADMRGIAIVQTVRVAIVGGRPAGRLVDAGPGRPRLAQHRRRVRSDEDRRTRDPGGGFRGRRDYRLPHPLSRRPAVRRHADVGCAARQRAHPRRDAVVGDQHGDDRLRRGKRLAFRRHADPHAPAFHRRRLRLLRGGSDRHGAEILGLPTGEVMIAYAPGAVDAMMLLALALNLDPVYVGAHHLTRIFFVSVTMPLVARRYPSGRVPKIPTMPPREAAAVRGLTTPPPVPACGPAVRAGPRHRTEPRPGGRSARRRDKATA